jgi:hypothetical protein
LVVAIALALVSQRAAAEPPPASTAQPASSPEGSVEITVVGAAGDLQRIRAVVGPLSLGGSLPRWMRVPRLEPMDILGTDRERSGVALRCWIDVTDPRHVRLYFAARSGQQFLVRDVELSGTFNEMDRESLSQVLSLSVTALLENERVGLTRAQTQTLLAQREKSAAPAPVAPPPVVVAQSAPPPATRGASGFGAGIFYGAQALGTSQPPTHGPGLSLSWGALGARLGLGAWVSGQYLLPQSESGSIVGMRFETVAARGGLELRWTAPSLGRPLLTGRLGIGTDFVRLSPQPGTVDPSATLTSTRWSQNWVFTAAVGFSWEVGRRMTLGGRIFADVLPTAVRYDVEVAGMTAPAFSPWRIRPGLALELALR